MKTSWLAVLLLCACSPASELVRSDAEPPGPNCATGGIAIHEGLDVDEDGVLADEEIETTSYVCNGAPGRSALVTIAAEPAGTNCTSGGTIVRAGIDSDADGSLDDEEVTETVYVCNGSDGSSQLVTTVSEPPGATCTLGGIAILIGTDTDRDGALDPDEVTSTSYVCDGA